VPPEKGEVELRVVGDDLNPREYLSQGAYATGSKQVHDEDPTIRQADLEKPRAAKQRVEPSCLDVEPDGAGT
jgi:hypothetical protein